MPLNLRNQVEQTKLRRIDNAKLCYNKLIFCIEMLNRLLINSWLFVHSLYLWTNYKFNCAQVSVMNRVGLLSAYFSIYVDRSR
jgi:hypothetical protein